MTNKLTLIINLRHDSLNTLMSDSASGSISGFLFQFEKALVLLASINDSDSVVTIENVDDVAIENDDSVVLLTVQQKHSISPNGTVFEDTSYALWRTIQIWIQKIQSNIFSNETSFVCSTNKKIKIDALICKIRDNEFETVLAEVSELLKDQKVKYTEAKNNGGTGASIKKVNTLIQFALNNQTEFKIIKEKLKILDEENLKDSFLSEVHLITKEYSDLQRDNVYENMYGWIVHRSLSMWRNGNIASFKKEVFNTKFAHVSSNPAITNAIFTEKSKHGSISLELQKAVRDELFVTQIQDIDRNAKAKERKIEKAILDYLYHDIEVARIVDIGNYTEVDFEEFKELCYEKWQTHYDSQVLKELSDYSKEEMNDLAINIFDSIMDNIVLDFNNKVTFNSSNKYIHNGAFLKLSNIPRIGWHPDWETKYRNE